ncbi:type II secretion system protein [Brockia lithotrophica]|uniref:Type II secretory pathway pseudopilin PulG n=1 Tax=Brockia lithotrophica TaxID=933949 RepID=A0A660KUJ5_9BACL|nr:hypothetical protein [Brockia lithotrophica]RKQ84724.1 type II secretory pathway pseudopilin PulG [Brockia lithotrophica]
MASARTRGRKNGEKAIPEISRILGKRRRCERDGGFGLAEVLAALVLFSLIAIVTLELVGESARIGAISRQKADGLELATAVATVYTTAPPASLEDEWQNQANLASTAPCPGAPHPGFYRLPQEREISLRALLPQGTWEEGWEVCTRLEKPYAGVYHLFVHVRGPLTHVDYDAYLRGEGP